MTFTGDTRGNAKLSVTVSDGFSQINETIYLSVPNTAPTLAVPSEKIIGKIGGVAPTLGGINLNDVDLADRANDANMRLNIETSEGASPMFFLTK